MVIPAAPHRASLEHRERSPQKYVSNLTAILDDWSRLSAVPASPQAKAKPGHSGRLFGKYEVLISFSQQTDIVSIRRLQPICVATCLRPGHWGRHPRVALKPHLDHLYEATAEITVSRRIELLFGAAAALALRYTSRARR
jgi:hypothetical protein